MRSWRESTFVFVTTNTTYGPDSVEERWLPVMSELVQLGASVQLLCDAHSPFAETARSVGVAVGPYVLDRWNVIRSRSRLRKYLHALPAGRRALDRSRGRPARPLGRARAARRRGRHDADRRRPASARDASARSTRSCAASTRPA